MSNAHVHAYTGAHKFRQRLHNSERRSGTSKNLLRSKSGQLTVIKLECNDRSRKENGSFQHVNLAYLDKHNGGTDAGMLSSILLSSF